MHASYWRGLYLLLVLTACSGSAAPSQPASPEEPPPPAFQVLVFSKTTEFRHDSIAAGIAAIEQLGREHGFAVTATEDAAVFTPEALRPFAAVVFLNTSGAMLDAAQQTAFEAYVQEGGGFVGVHGAAASEYDWAWYGGLVGAFFADHPTPQEAEVLVVDRVHPSTQHLPARWRRFDEWYNYRANPRATVHVLAALDEKSYDGGSMGHDHPIAWAHQYDGGRAWYTGLGHTVESYAEPLFLEHLLGGIAWAAGIAPGDVGSGIAAHYDKVVLMDAVTDPMELAVAADGTVFVVERMGAIKMWDPATETARQVGYLPVHMVIEDGLLGIALDPRFDETGWLYVFYAPQGGGPSRLSRLTFDGTQVDRTSERVLLEVPVQRQYCCHAGGSLAFDAEGNLYLSTGDNTDPNDRDGSPIDERPGRAHADAQASSANTNDLRGKILRIRPLPDGTYAIPEGNLFAPGTPQTRPEIYTMGHRNPFRIAIDPQTGDLYWGDVGNGDAPNARGGWGWDEFNVAREAGNFGWPHFSGANQPYNDYDYATGAIGEPFDPAAPINDSPHNTGLRTLPPAQPAMIWYTYGMSDDFPALGAGGINPMAGPLYRYVPATAGPTALPPYYHGKHLIYEWMRNWVQVVSFDDAGAVLKIDPFLPGMAFVRPMDVEVGPDGTLYLIEWGDSFWGSNADAQVVRLDYHGSPARLPKAALRADVTSGTAPLRVQFAGREDGAADTTRFYLWDFDDDGIIDARDPDAAFVYAQPGTYTARLSVVNGHGSDTDAMTITVGNTAPTVAITWPVEGGFFGFDEPIAYKARITDPEDASVAEERVIAQGYTGFDTHELALPAQTGAQGMVTITHAFTHTPDLHFMNRFAVFEVRYTDGGAAGVGPLTTTARVMLQPKHKEAEHTTTRHGAVRKTYGMHPATAHYEASALTILEIKDGAHVSYAPVNLSGIDALTFRLKARAAGTIDVRLDAVDGPLLAEVAVDSASTRPVARVAQVRAMAGLQAAASGEHPFDGLDENAYTGWAEATVPVTDPGGTHTLVLVFRSDATKAFLELDWIRFEGDGMSYETMQR